MTFRVDKDRGKILEYVAISFMLATQPGQSMESLPKLLGRKWVMTLKLGKTVFLSCFTKRPQKVLWARFVKSSVSSSRPMYPISSLAVNIKC